MSKSELLPTYAQIAAKAKVSTKTVCNVLRTPEIVREKTIKKVRDALKELGVHDPKVMVARQRPKRDSRTRSLLLLISGMNAGWLSAPIYSSIIHAAELRAHELGWQLSLRHRQPGEDLRETLKNYRGQGVILFGQATLYSELTSVLPKVAAVRLLLPPEGRMDCDNVDYDHSETSRIAARYLKDKGCSKVAFLGPARPPRGEDFCKAAKALGLSVVNGISESIYESRNGTQIVDHSKLLEVWNELRKFGPEGVFVHSDHITNAFYSLLEKQGVQPGRDLHIISCNADELFLSPLRPRPATIDIHPAEMGRRSIDQIVWRMSNADAPPAKLVIWPQLVPGEGD
jgi:DNA-binding LacI/PurR family transcriptional regulator